MTKDDKILAIEFFEFVQKHMTDYKDIWEAWKAFQREKRR